ncbi:MAG: DEAD/DEAH box helicase family protein [Coriobacteriia bacterium]|nr:DEAD/DEAH box helicase family protein [Coriobacteriia bacterium]
MALELKYSADQEYQIEAVESACGLFRGQEFMDACFTAGGTEGGTLFEGTNAKYAADALQIGHANGMRLSSRQLEENLHAIQEEWCLPATSVTTDGHLRDFSVEMETGTGKTYIYIRTIYELNRRYGLTKFIIVVPGVAIREGVRKSFESMAKHFGVLYDNTPLEHFVYDGKDMGPVGNFATSASIQVMIINIDSFNSSFQDDGGIEKGNLFHRPSEKLIGGHSPRELVASCNPVVIIDEPQSVDNTPKAKAAIRSLNPLFVLRYSATHKEVYNEIYRLTPVDAFQRGLVKGICVDSVLSQEDLNGSYVRLESVKAKPFTAKLTLDVRQADGSKKRKKLSVKTGDDLYIKSGENTDYEAGWVVDNISAAEGDEWVEFQNGEVIKLGQAVGDIPAEAVKRAQIRRTIEDHLQRQLALRQRGIKVLSLFFIDDVEKYRLYDPVRGGEYAQMFEEEYAAAMPRWRPCYEKAGVPLDTDAAAIHTGYFSRDGKGKLKNTSGTTNADISTYETIMRSKEALISFPSPGDTDEERAKKRIQFIWSHSTLKEGWDNPNVFQICTLVETKDAMTKRQKIGRGLRLCVNQDGERCYDRDVNILTVIANESYDEFASGLQTEFEKEGYRFGVLTAESFTHVIVEQGDGREECLGYVGSRRLFEFLEETGLVDKKGSITPELKQAAEEGRVPMPAGMEGAQPAVETIILRKAQKLQIRDKAKEVEVELSKDVSLDPAFQELWERIRKRTRFEVDVDSDKLVEMACAEIGKMPEVKSPEVISTRAELSVGEGGVEAEARSTSIVRMDSTTAYDLPDPIAELQDAVGLTRATIKRILEGCGRFEEFKLNPALFLSQVAAKINKAKAQAIAEGIKYTKLPDDEWYTMRDLDPGDFKAYLGQNAWEPVHSKSLYNYVVYDSSTVEKPFAVELDQAEEIKVFAKLPSKFKIDTPLGSYNPDWAYVQEIEGERRVYFVTETKGGGNNDIRVNDTERGKIRCARRHFEAIGEPDLKYDVRTTYRTGGA